MIDQMTIRVRGVDFLIDMCLPLKNNERPAILDCPEWYHLKTHG
jgi:hypothetical protein